MPYDCQHKAVSIDMEDSIINGRLRPLHPKRNHFLLATNERWWMRSEVEKRTSRSITDAQNPSPKR